MRSLTTGAQYGLSTGLAIAGLVVAIAGQGRDIAMECGSIFIGAALSVLVLSLLIGYAACGEPERDAEEAARQYFDDHGHWPDELPPTSRRAWPSAITHEFPAGGPRSADPTVRHARVLSRRGRGRRAPWTPPPHDSNGAGPGRDGPLAHRRRA
jgi:hypothetical protein